MKRCLFFCIFMLFAVFCQAEEFPLRANNSLLWDGVVIPCSDDSHIVYRVDTSLGTSQILADKVSATGNLVWNNALQLAETPEPKYLLGVVPSSDGCQIAVWIQKSTDSGYAICHMKIDSNGIRQWAIPGTAASGLSTFVLARVVPNQTGGFYLIYRGFLNDNTILMNNFGADGTSLWAEPRILLSHSDRIDLESAWPDGSGGFLANLLKRTTTINWTSHLIRINPAGEIQGSSPLLPSSPFTETNYKLLASPQGDFLIHRLVDNGNYTLQLQKIDTAGNLLCQTRTFPIASVSYITGCELDIFSDGRILAAFETQIGVADDFRLRFQIFNAELNPAWQGGCLETMFSHPESSELSTEISPDGSYWLFWQGRIAGFNPSGQSILPNDGLPITEQEAESPVLSCANGNCLLVWAEDPNTHQLRRQVLNSTGTALLPSGGLLLANCLESNAENARVYALGNRWISLWEDERVVFSAGQIYYQILQGDQALLEPQGRALNPYSANSDHFMDSIVLPDNSLAILYGTWIAEQYSVWLQIIDHNGDKAYPGRGIQVSLEQESSTVHNFHLGFDGTDFYIGWNRLRTGIGKFVVAQRVSGGVAQWGSSGLIVQTYPMAGTYYLVALHKDCLVWTRHPSTDPNTQLMALRLDEAGFPITGWPAEGLCVASTPGNSNYISSGLLQDKYMFIYSDPQHPTGTRRAQLFAPNGTMLWGPEGISLFGTQTYCSILDLVYDDKCSLIYTWGSNPGLRFMRVNQAGILEADPEDNLISPISFTGEGLSLIRYAGGDYSCFYSHPDPVQPAWYGRNLYCQQINSEGRPWGVHTITDAYEDQSLPWAAAQGDFSLVVWKDLRANLPGYSEDRNSVFASVFQSNSLGVEEDIPQPVTSTIRNYPNPFRDNTTIQYSLDRSSHVNLEIYNLRGQLVRKLLNQDLPKGVHTLNWDGCDQNGRALASGIYCCRFSDGAQTTAIKMLLLH